MVKGRNVPSSILKKRAKIAEMSKKTSEAKALKIQKSKQLKEYALAQGQKYAEAFEKKQAQLVQEKKEAFLNNEFFVEQESPFFLVIRIKGLSKIAPK